MRISRWLRTVARALLVGVAVALVLSLPIAIIVDRGPDGGPRTSPHFFPLALWVFDDFAWTCASNSVIFATAVSLVSFAGGVSLGWVLARARHWAQIALQAPIWTLLVVSPAMLALGLEGLVGTPRAWPWPLNQATDLGLPGTSLESWQSFPLWIAWIWSTAPWGVALVAFATAGAVARLEPSWIDAARLTGAGRVRRWRSLNWPMVRPVTARAAAIVFVYSLSDPGAPLVLGLRRTLAFQVVAIAGRSEPFPTLAVWGLMTGLAGALGWFFWRWAGGAPILQFDDHQPSASRQHRLAGTAERARGVLTAALVAGWALIGWAPVAGLIPLAISDRSPQVSETPGLLPRILAGAWRLGEPPIPQILFNSAGLGMTLAATTIAAAWLVRPNRGGSSAWVRALRRLAGAPPLIQGIGVLACSWLSGLAASAVANTPALSSLSTGLALLSRWTDPRAEPWLALTIGVGIAVVPRCALYWRRQISADGHAQSRGSATLAAILAGASRSQAARLSTPWGGRSRTLAALLLVGALAATNMTPALLFEPWTDVRTASPSVTKLAGGDRFAKSQAAMLALGAIALNVSSLAAARALSAVPRTLDLE
jgi:ABC-type Fe3+ transport system permease subunit